MRSCLSASAKGSQRLVLMAATNADVPTAMRKADEVAGLQTAGHKVSEVVRVTGVSRSSMFRIARAKRMKPASMREA